ncbi:MAG: hypothetical protein IKY90_08970 [Oscillospiraceae bacterium]|nr:hypothetical protein [Oscillospiraceae bacterium]
MNIGIIDADLIGKKKHRFPNLACMKISAFHKKKGDTVKLLLSYDEIENYDKVFISKVFTDTSVPEGVLSLSWVEYGGTGFFYDKAPPLPYEIEHSMPDYHLYDEWVANLLENGTKPIELQYYTDASIGYTTRGCIRGCSFCVNQNYRQCFKHSPVSEFLDETRKIIILLDDNVLACPQWEEIFAELNATGKRFQYRQGMDERLLTDKKCEVIFNSRWYGEYTFAFDNIKDRRIIERKLQLIRKYTDKIPKFYLFCGYNHDEPDTYNDDFWAKDIEDLFERIKILMSNKCLPYVMRYKDYEMSPYRGVYVTLARWCNQPSFFKKKSFREFCLANGEKSAAVRYMTDLEQKCPDIARKYFDMKWGDFN